MTDSTFTAQSPLELAQAAAGPVEVEPGKHYVIPAGDGTMKLLDLRNQGENPLRATGKRTLRDTRSFMDYVHEHATSQTEVFANTELSTVTAVIDSHGNAGVPGHQEHTATLELVTTKEWQRWLEFNGKMLPQLDFANFAEENAADIVTPASAEFLEMAQSLQASTNVDFKSGIRLNSGQTKLQYEETVNAKAGEKGDITIPTEFTIAVRPYVGGPAYGILARFRYRIAGSGLSMGYVLDRPHAVLEEAFKDMVNAIRFGIPAESIPMVKDDQGAVLESLDLPAIGGLTWPVRFGKAA